MLEALRLGMAAFAVGFGIAAGIGIGMAVSRQVERRFMLDEEAVRRLIEQEENQHARQVLIDQLCGGITSAARTMLPTAK